MTLPSRTERADLRLGACLAVAGLAVQLPLGNWHPHEQDPNASREAFIEYAQSNDWVLVHIGQFLGAALVCFGLVLLARTLARPRGVAGALALIGGAAAIVATAVFAVQMAVDGVALDAAIGAWLDADPGNRAAAFLVADSIRAVEKGLSGFFHLSNGITLLAFGLSIAIGRHLPRALGWIGAAAGAAFLALGSIVAHTGFSAAGATVALVATVLVAVFLTGLALVAWLRTPVSSTAG